MIEKKVTLADRMWRPVELAVPDSVTEDDLPERAKRVSERIFGKGAWHEALWTAAYRKHERRAAKFVGTLIELSLRIAPLV